MSDAAKTLAKEYIALGEERLANYLRILEKHANEDAEKITELAAELTALKHAIRNAYSLLDDDHIEAGQAVLQMAIDKYPIVKEQK